MSIFDDFCRFATAHVRSGDVDPMYPVLRRFYERTNVSLERALWRTLLYVGWYHIGSAETVWRKAPDPRLLQEVDVWGLPTGIERRGFRGNAKAIDFVNGVLERAPAGLAAWAGSFARVGGTEGWDAARAEIQAVRFGGAWASYKFADLLLNVHGLPIRASDIGVGGKGETAGPIPGMVRLTGLTWQECASDVVLQNRLLERCRIRGVPFQGLDQLETSLCDFNSLCKGTYYVGHDIDMQMAHLKASDPGLRDSRDVFEDRYRGERSGWEGVRSELKPAYRDLGRIEWWSCS